MAATDAPDTALILLAADEDRSWHDDSGARELRAPRTHTWRAAARAAGLASCLAALVVLVWQGAQPSGGLRGETRGAVAAFRAPTSSPPAVPAAPAPPGLLQYAAAMYSAATAEAFAQFTKLAYCGPQPGVANAAARSCGAEAEGPCKQAQFRVYPGAVRTFSAGEQGVSDSLFGFVAMLQPVGENNTVSSGVLISIRGAIDENTNTLRDKQTGIVRGLLGCEECGVHEGYHIAYEKVKPQIDSALSGLGCKPPFCRIYLTGHGAGAAVSSIAAWELYVQNYSVGTSYLFSAPRVGDETFAKKMGETFMGQKAEPIFHVTYGKDSSVRWPFDASYKDWGFEAYYATVPTGQKPSVTAAAPQICLAGQEGCGLERVPKAELTTLDMCRSPLADSGTLCTFTSYQGTCQYGWSLQTARATPENLLGPAQPLQDSAATWHPSEQSGALAVAMVEDKDARDYYSLPTLRAFSALVKLSYCSVVVGLSQSVPNTCTRMSNNLCGQAGFGVVAGTVVPRTVNGTLFFYTALLRRRSPDFAKKPYFMPAEACVLVIRGTVNSENMDMNVDAAQVPINDTKCPGCTVNHGLQAAWQNLLEPVVVDALAHSGCQANSAKPEVSKSVILAGHSMGGAMATLAMYWLQKRGFQVQLSWSIEGGRPGNPAFMTYLNEELFAGVRPVPFWLTTHQRDVVPRTVNSVFAGGPAGRAQFMLHFPNSTTSHVFCTTKADIAKDSNCGIYQVIRSQLASWRATDHCGLPFAPGGDICHPTVPDCLFGR